MIPLDTVGRITTGEFPGWFVVVRHDSADTGGVYIFVSSTADFESSPEGTDFWVEKLGDLPQFFAESGWEVDWNG
jgi:hypothetical protein